MIPTFLQLAKRLLPPATRRRLRAWGIKLFPQLRYPWWIRGRVNERRLEYGGVAFPLARRASEGSTPRLRVALTSVPHTAPLFSILTPVFDTEARFLRELADSLFNQDFPCFEWVLVDNGSTRPGTRAVLGRICSDPRVKRISLETNRGIIGGMRAALEAATGRYVLPVDHDDRLYPDALRVMACSLHQHGYPVAAYSDEDKLLSNGRPGRPFCKPDWDPLLLLNCCYPAHLAAFSREVAKDLDFYSDPAAEGCPDWDAFLRLARAGHTPLHVPEILYSWRMHSGSTADPHAGAKPYTLDAQYRLLTGHLSRLSPFGPLAVRSNSLSKRPGLWRLVRRHLPPTPPIHVFALGPIHDSLAASTYPALRIQAIDRNNLQSAISNLQSDDLVAVLQEDLRILNADWPWEALGLFELFPDLAVVGGRLLAVVGRVRSAGEVFGMGGILGSPCRGWPATTARRHGRLICQRFVSAVDGSFFIARAGFLAEVLSERVREWESDSGPTLSLSHSPSLVGTWLAAAARRRGLRIAYSPHIVAQDTVRHAPVQSDEEAWQFLQEHWPLLLDDHFYSRFCSLREGHGWQLTSAEERCAVLNSTLCRLAGLHSCRQDSKKDPESSSPRLQSIYH